MSYTLASNRDDTPQAQVTDRLITAWTGGPANIDRRNSLVASGSADLPWKFNLGLIWQARSSSPFSAYSTVQVDGVTQYVNNLTRNMGNRDNGAVKRTAQRWDSLLSRRPQSITAASTASTS